MNRSDHRRARLAIVFTIVAIPAMLLANRDTSADPTASAPGNEASAPSTSQYRPEPPVFVDNRVPAVPPAVVDVLVPAPPSAQQADAVASFRRFGNVADRPCATELAPVTALVTVTNVDNGRTMQCTNVGNIGMPPDVDVVIHTDIFSELGDLIDAPLSVRISW
jgi:hypothetical protein